MRGYALALIAVCGGFAHAQDTSKKVSLNLRASRTPTVLAELSKVAGVKLEAANSAMDDVLVVAVKDVTVADLLKRIATTTASEWKPIDGGFRLVPDPITRRKQRAAEEKARIDALNKDIQKKWDEATKASADAKGTGSVTIGAQSASAAFSSGGPGQKTIIKLIAGVERGLLSDVRKGDRIVFSTSPTPMQRPLAANAIGLIDQFVVEHNAAAAKNKRQSSAEEDKMLAAMPAFIREMAGREGKRIENATKALLIVSRQSILDMVQCEMRLYDDKGAVVGSEQMSLNEGDLMSMVEEMDLDPTKPKKPKKEEPGNQTPIEYSEDSKAFEGLKTAFSTASIKISPDTLKKIRNPESYDPLSFASTDEVLSCGKSLGLNVVANLPDSAASVMGNMVGGKQTVASVLAKLGGDKELKRIDDAGWLTILPAKPERARQERLSRSALGTLVRAAADKGMASLDDMANYALAAPDPMEGGIGQEWLTMFVPGGVSMTMNGITSWDMLRFYGALDPATRVTLSRGGRMMLSNLNAIQRTALMKMVYGAGGRLEVRRQGDPEATDMFTKMIMQFAGGGGRDYLEEPTESLAGGLPGDGYLTLAVESEPTVNPVAGEGSMILGSSSAMGPDELAMIKMMKEDKNMSAMAGFLPTFEKVRIGSRTKLSFSFHFTPVISRSETLMDHKVDKSASEVDFSALPPNVTSAIDQRLAEIKKSPFGSMLGAFGAMGAMNRRGAQP